MKKLWKSLTKQHNTGPYIGMLINTYSTTGILYSPLTFLGVVSTVYGLWGGTFLRTYLPWFTTFHLMGSMIIVGLIMMLIFFKVVIPSIYAFQVKMQYKHQNPLVADMQKALSNQSSILTMLDSINNRLDELEGVNKTLDK